MKSNFHSNKDKDIAAPALMKYTNDDGKTTVVLFTNDGGVVVVYTESVSHNVGDLCYDWNISNFTPLESNESVELSNF